MDYNKSVAIKLKLRRLKAIYQVQRQHIVCHFSFLLQIITKPKELFWFVNVNHIDFSSYAFQSGSCHDGSLWSFFVFVILCLALFDCYVLFSVFCNSGVKFVLFDQFCVVLCVFSRPRCSSVQILLFSPATPTLTYAQSSFSPGVFTFSSPSVYKGVFSLF